MIDIGKVRFELLERSFVDDNRLGVTQRQFHLVDRSVHPGDTTVRPMAPFEQLLTTPQLGRIVALLAVDEDRFATMGRFFLIAVLVLSPWWLPGAVRRIRARSAERARVKSLALGSATVVAPPGSLAEVLAELERHIDADDVEFELHIPTEVTISGGVADPVIVESVLADAFRRSRVSLTSERADGAGRTLCCKKIMRAAEEA